MIPLQAITPDHLVRAIEGLSLVEARKIVSAVDRKHELPSTVRHVRRTSLEAVRAVGTLPRLAVLSVRPSRIDPFVKYALETSDGHLIETVRIPLERPGRYSVCVSSQVGCGLACAFCATGRMGLRRNLKAWEIVEQVRVVRGGLEAERRQRVHGVVFQGMGEPLVNVDNVIEAIRILTEPSALAIDGRNITVCSAGIPAGIRKLAAEAPKARLAISIGSARKDVRLKLMPVHRAFPLEEVLDTAADHALATALAPMWAVTLLAGVNDSDDDARELARLAERFVAKTGLRPRISIVPYNAIDSERRDQFQRTSSDREASFRRVLREAGFGTHKRYSGGGDIAAACGQLASAPFREIQAQKLPKPILEFDLSGPFKICADV